MIHLEVNDQCPACDNPAGIPAEADGNDDAFNCVVCGERLNTRMDTTYAPTRVWLVTEASVRAAMGGVK
ncbi:hypothetical protein [Myxococcus landrumensis]|uniref:Uncharacterized protein n=1 Tax=Myxococcus landrumensis TaxID=2813577 RepID=A0ABX7N5K6_9BACT|nr:hypothetical protein [Myxococcus landrumus]QSQ14067.1 hypothetical protein JY572_38095 [Myxococcus landrumus]